MRPEYAGDDPTRITAYILDGLPEIEEAQVYVEILDNARIDDSKDTEDVRTDAENIRQALHDCMGEVRVSEYSGRMLMKIIHPQKTMIMPTVLSNNVYPRKKVGTRA